MRQQKIKHFHFLIYYIIGKVFDALNEKFWFLLNII